MLKFSQFLLSENVNVGQKVHYQGNVSEHAYHKALLKYSLHNLIEAFFSIPISAILIFLSLKEENKIEKNEV